MMLLSLAFAVEPHFSYPKLVSANGYGAVVWNDDRLQDAFPHLYQEYSPGVVTPDILFDTYFGIVDESGGHWFLEWESVEYLPGTPVIRATGTVGDYDLVLHAVVPMETIGFALAQELTVTATAPHEAQLVSLQNWHVGAEEDAYSASADRVEERGSEASLYLVGVDATDASCSGVYETVSAGARIGGGCDSTGPDVVPGFGWSVSLAAGESVTVRTYASTDPSDGYAESVDWVPTQQALWELWHAEGTTPPTMDEAEAAVWRQSLTFLKMAQVREVGDAYGQIPASLPLSAPVGDFQHIWNITWVRDGTLAAVALNRAGHGEEARAAVAFLGQGKTGEYRAYVADLDYLVSVCRVYGDGTEWSDSDANGPNVEFDNFGMYLWALGQVADDPFLAQHGIPALDGVADVLVRLIDPSTGLLQPDSSIWERHWNGNQQQFTWSQAWAVAGLEAAAKIAMKIGDARADRYAEAADGLRSAIASLLVDSGGVVAASREQLESGSDYYDLSAVEVFNLGILDDPGPSLDAWDRELRVSSGNGYMRNDDGDTYDSHEWAVMDLRAATAFDRSGDPGRADDIEDWITAQAMLNNATVPELFHPDTGDFAGPAPMLGFGAGAYVLYLLDRADRGLGPNDDGAPDTPCGGCATSPARVPGALLLASLLLLSRRR